MWPQVQVVYAMPGGQSDLAYNLIEAEGIRSPSRSHSVPCHGCLLISQTGLVNGFD